MKQRSACSIMARLVVLVGPLLPLMLLAVLLGVFGFLCATFLTVLGGWALLSAAGQTAPAPLTVLFFLAVLCALARGFLRYGEQACNHFIAFQLLALIRDKVFYALRRLCPAKLEGRDKGDLIAVITSDIELLEVFYAHTISPAAIAVLTSLILTIFIGCVHPVLGLIAACAYLSIGWLLPVWLSKRGGTDAVQFRTGAGQLSGFMLDSLRGLNETLQYAQGAARLEALSQRTAQLSETEARMKTKAAQGTAATNTLVLFFALLLLAAGAVLYGWGSIPFEGLLISFLALLGSFGPVIALANLGSTLQNTLAAGGRVLDILDEPPQVAEVSDGLTVEFTGASCEGVTFSYPSSRQEGPILRDLTLTLPRGEIIGIVGRSGSGKSTLLRLFMRFWDVDHGSVRLSGEDVRRLNTADLRALEGFMTQDTYLFHDSIANNLRLAKPDATQEDLETACRKASIHNFILTLPRGYDTLVGELGDTLSGGERQRLGLARAFLHHAPFLLLDEPTSNLDSLNEAVILRSLQNAQEDTTIVLVSHRASTMSIAHRVFSAERGRIS